MFPRIINSHFSTGQEVHSWSPVLPAWLLCPCCPATAAQPQAMPGPFRACAPGHGGSQHSSRHSLPQGTRASLTQSFPDRATGLSRAGSDLGKVGSMLKGGSEAGQRAACGDAHCWCVSSRAAHSAQLNPTQRTLEFSIASVPRAALQAWVVQTAAEITPCPHPL